MGFRVLAAALLSAALILLAPHKQAPPAQINKVERPAKAVQVRTEQPRKAVTAKSQEKVQAKPKPSTPEITVAKAVRPKPRTVAQGCDSYRSTFEQYGWNVNTAIAVCKAESGGNVYALSSTRDRGLMQINPVHADKVDYDLSRLYDPYTNIRVAYSVYLGQGWNGWSAYKNGSYLRYL